MIAEMLNKSLDLLGFRLVRNPRPEAGAAQLGQCRGLLAQLAQEPMDADAHATLAALALERRQPFLAHAQARNAAWLEPAEERFNELVAVTCDGLPPLPEIGHNGYHRLQALARILRANGRASTSSVLDVGGGNGELAAFLPGSPYFLADPSSNGVSAADLPDGIGQFDYVVSCHVLEHVEPGSRDQFLDALVSRMQTAVILLNPFHLDDTSEEERLRLVIDVTGADWAREHLECALPHLPEMQRYAEARGLYCSVEPVGSMTTTLAYVFLEYFARRAGMANEMRRINGFFNDRLCDAEISEKFPTGFAVVLRREALTVESA